MSGHHVMKYEVSVNDGNIQISECRFENCGCKFQKIKGLWSRGKVFFKRSFKKRQNCSIHKPEDFK